MKNLEEIARLNEEVFTNILFATQEELGRELVVILRGKRIIDGKIVFEIKNAIPLMNTKRKPSEVKFTNDASIKRIIDLDKTLSRLDSGYKIIGHYHTHPETERKPLMISKTDLDNSVLWMKYLGLKYYFIDFVGRIIRIKYDKPQKKSLEIEPNNKGLKILSNFRTTEGFELYLKAFKIKLDRDRQPYVEKELQIELPNYKL